MISCHPSYVLRSGLYYWTVVIIKNAYNYNSNYIIMLSSFRSLEKVKKENGQRADIDL